MLGRWPVYHACAQPKENRFVYHSFSDDADMLIALAGKNDLNRLHCAAPLFRIEKGLVVSAHGFS